MDGFLLTEKLLRYAKKHLHLDEFDEVYTRNVLLSELKLSKPCEQNADLSSIDSMDVPDELWQELKEYAIENNLADDDTADIFCANIFGLLTPVPSEINREFHIIKEKSGIQAACDYLFDMCIKNGYIQKTAIARNLKWDYEDEKNKLEITINLSKPEKNNKDIAKLLTMPQGNKYPQCMLCKENEGFEGTMTHPPRRNLRTIKVNLNGEKWFMQYSPYAYYDEHCIVINEEHIPMRVDEKTPYKLLDFVDAFPNYFIGSNASLPIVGGSILNHEHYQGGRHLMPMHFAKIKKEYTASKYPDLKIGILDWYNSVIQIEGKSRDCVAAFAAEVIKEWKEFSCPECEIISHTGQTPHNAVSPICRKSGDTYIMSLILRNNRTNEQYPDGIFHVHPEYQNIKSEGIGLIEAMGLFILPGRLKRQLDEIENILFGKSQYDQNLYNDKNHDLYIHRNMIQKLMNEGMAKDKAQAHERVQNYVNRVCAAILDNTSVFKNDEIGKKGFQKFIKTLNLQEV
ncbi:MAG TPA: UDP-glucose--hexose-1-phosphate uridylyltransferase [Clostridia bacterium]